MINQDQETITHHKVNMKKANLVATITAVLTIAAVADAGFVKHHLASLIQFSQERNASLLVCDEHDQARGLAVLSSGRVLDIPTEIKGFSKPKTSRAAPSLSPDGAHVAFAQSATETQVLGQQEIWNFDLRSGASSKIAKIPGVLSVTWSPAGNALAVNVGKGELRVLVLASQQSKVIATDISSNVPSWSPDGHKIAYESATRKGDTWESHVNVVDVESGQIVRLTAGRCPSWSPRGDQIAYLDQQKQKYLTVSAIGGPSSPLIKTGKIPGDPILSQPVVWSPDGHFVVVTGYYDGGTSMTLVELSTSKKNVLHHGGDWLLASWR
jgi:Tol biopolymer transport system component